jgi:hypothetical protein
MSGRFKSRDQATDDLVFATLRHRNRRRAGCFESTIEPQTIYLWSLRAAIKGVVSGIADRPRLMHIPVSTEHRPILRRSRD